MRYAFLVALFCFIAAPLAQAQDAKASNFEASADGVQLDGTKISCVKARASSRSVYACHGRLWLNGLPFEPGKRVEHVPVRDDLPPPIFLEAPVPRGESLKEGERR